MRPLAVSPGYGAQPFEDHMLKALILIVSGVCTPAQGAAAVSLPESDLRSALADPENIKIVEAEIVHLRLSGRLAALKAAVLTERMVDKLLAMDPTDVNPALVAKLAELGAKLTPMGAGSLTPGEKRAQKRQQDDDLQELFMGLWRRLQATKNARQTESSKEIES